MKNISEHLLIQLVLEAKSREFSLNDLCKKYLLSSKKVQSYIKSNVTADEYTAIIENSKILKRVKLSKNKDISNLREIRDTCLNCNELKKSRKTKFCTRKCSIDFRWKEIKEKISSGEYLGYRTSRHFLCEEFGEICSECKQGSIWNNKPLTLHVDHIDGNSDNNNIANLRLLCPNCHTQTETFSNRNENSSRTYRSKRMKLNRGYLTNMVG